MKTKLFIIFLLLNISFVFAQLTPKWEKLSSGLNYFQDSTSDKDNYIFSSPHLSGYFSLSSWYDSDPGIEPLSKLDSNSYARIVYEVDVKFPKSAEYFYENDYKNTPLLNLKNNLVHIEISTDGLKSWQRVYTFQANTEKPFNDAVFIDTLCGFRLQFVNDSTIILFGSIKEALPTTHYMASGFVATLKKSKSGNQWDFTEKQFWKRTNSFLTQMVMLDEKIGYGVLLWNFFNARTAILYTNDGWSTYKEIFSSKIDPNLEFGGGWYKNLCVSADNKDTLISFSESSEELIYYSKDNFKTFYNIDFTSHNHILQIYNSNPKTIYALIGKLSNDANNSKFIGNVFLKSTNYGNTWEEICKSNDGDQIQSFEMFDENHFIFKGFFHPQGEQSRCAFWGTTDGGKTLQYIYEPNIKIDGRFSTYYDYVYKYLYKNKDQIICLKNRLNFEQPFFDKDLSFFNHIKEIFNNGYTNKYDYFCSSNEIELPPPFIKFDDSLISKNNFGTDTLYWNKIPGADSYNISYFGIADASFHNISESSRNNPLNFSTLTTARIDTTVKDTFLIMNGLKRNYKYEIWASAQNNAQKSIETLLISVCKDSLFMLEKPVILYPMEKDTVPTGEITFQWNSVPFADSYNITLFDSKSKTLFSSFSTKMRFLLNSRNVQDTFYVFKGLEPDRNYTLSITAQNDEEVTDYSVLHFCASNNVSVRNENISEANIYPNPASDHITLNIPPLEKRGLGGVLLEIRIFDIFGNDMQTTPALRATPPLQGGEIRIDISALPTGIYFLKIDNEKLMKFVKI